MWVWEFRPGSSSTSPPKQRAKGTEAVVTLLLRNRKERRGETRQRGRRSPNIPQVETSSNPCGSPFRSSRLLQKTGRAENCLCTTETTAAWAAIVRKIPTHRHGYRQIIRIPNGDGEHTGVRLGMSNASVHADLYFTILFLCAALFEA